MMFFIETYDVDEENKLTERKAFLLLAIRRGNLLIRHETWFVSKEKKYELYLQMSFRTLLCLIY